MRFRARNWLLFLAILVLTASALLSGCSSASGPGQTVAVTLTDSGIEPKEIMIPGGADVTLEVTNKGTMTHNLGIADLNAKSEMVDPGKSVKLTLKNPKKGSHEVICQVAGHKELGMVAKLTVQ
jgi:nitrite reductase (NO-forming)